MNVRQIEKKVQVRLSKHVVRDLLEPHHAHTLDSRSAPFMAEKHRNDVAGNPDLNCEGQQQHAVLSDKQPLEPRGQNEQTVQTDGAFGIGDSNKTTKHDGQQGQKIVTPIADQADNMEPTIFATSTPEKRMLQSTPNFGSPISQGESNSDRPNQTYGIINMCEASTMDENDIRLFDCVPKCDFSLSDEDVQKILRK